VPFAPQHLDIGEVVFRCPLTRRDAQTGIIIDRRSLEFVGHLATRFLCSACGTPHMVRLQEARLMPICTGGS
jgi:hypothetical protein